METFFFVRIFEIWHFQNFSSWLVSGRRWSDGGRVAKNSGRIESSGEWGRIGAQISERAPAVRGDAGSQNSLNCQSKLMTHK